MEFLIFIVLALAIIGYGYFRKQKQKKVERPPIKVDPIADQAHPDDDRIVDEDGELIVRDPIKEDKIKDKFPPKEKDDFPRK